MVHSAWSLGGPSCGGAAEEQQAPVAITAVQQQHHTNQDSLIPLHTQICQPESQGVLNKNALILNSPIRPG